jgi:hypothetical protein
MADQPNRGFFTYTDSHGTAWNKMGAIDAGCNAIDGSSAAVAGQPDYPRESRRRHARKAIFVDPTTLRQKQCIMYTAAALAALTGASTLAVPIQGAAGTVSYTFARSVDDKAPVNSVSTHKADR